MNRVDIIKKLKKVIDPELNVNIVDLGLIYSVDLDKENCVKITMTLTTPHCPLSDFFISEIEIKLSELDFISEVNVDIVWDPPWNINMMSAKAWNKLFKKDISRI